VTAPAEPTPPKVPAGLRERLERVQGLAAHLVATRSKRDARPLARALREEVRVTRVLLPPIAGRLLARVARDAEAASGSVVEKTRRLGEWQDSWEQLLRLLGGL
jgi:hypothetical protein